MNIHTIRRPALGLLTATATAAALLLSAGTPAQAAETETACGGTHDTLNNGGGFYAEVDLCLETNGDTARLLGSGTCHHPAGTYSSCHIRGTWTATAPDGTTVSAKVGQDIIYPGPGTYRITAQARAEAPAGMTTVRYHGQVARELSLQTAKRQAAFTATASTETQNTDTDTVVTYTITKNGDSATDSLQFTAEARGENRLTATADGQECGAHSTREQTRVHCYLTATADKPGEVVLTVKPSWGGCEPVKPQVTYDDGGTVYRPVDIPTLNCPN